MPTAPSAGSPVRRGRRQRDRASQGRGVIRSRVLSEDMEAPRRGSSARGKRAWGQLLRRGMSTPVLTNGEAVKKWPSSLEKARQRRRLALKSRRAAGPSAYPIARRRRSRRELPQRRRRACGGDCAASQPHVLCRPLLRPSPRERRGRQTRCMRYLKPSIHSVSARVPRPSAASIAALYPRNA